jgi:hypothetical protein
MIWAFRFFDTGFRKKCANREQIIGFPSMNSVYLYRQNTGKYKRIITPFHQWIKDIAMRHKRHNEWKTNGYDHMKWIKGIMMRICEWKKKHEQLFNNKKILSVMNCWTSTRNPFFVTTLKQKVEGLILQRESLFPSLAAKKFGVLMGTTCCILVARVVPSSWGGRST